MIRDFVARDETRQIDYCLLVRVVWLWDWTIKYLLKLIGSDVHIWFGGHIINDNLVSWPMLDVVGRACNDTEWKAVFNLLLLIVQLIRYADVHNSECALIDAWICCFTKVICVDHDVVLIKDRGCDTEWCFAYVMISHVGINLRVAEIEVVRISMNNLRSWYLLLFWLTFDSVKFHVTWRCHCFISVMLTRAVIVDRSNLVRIAIDLIVANCKADYWPMKFGCLVY